MILTISQYVEALTGGDRFRTLTRVRPVSGNDGAPGFVMPGHGLVDFEVCVDGVPHTLRCPLRFGADDAFRLYELGRRETGLGGRFFTEWSLLKREIVLFDEVGTPVEVDILARHAPCGERFGDFLERVVARGDTAAARVALRSFEEMVLWANSVGRSGIVPGRLVVSPDGAVSLTGFSANDRTEFVRGMLQDAASGKKPVGKLSEAAVDYNSEYEEFAWDDYWDVATVMANGEWMLVDRSGARLTAETYDWIGECSEGLILAQKGAKCGFLSCDGREAIPFEYDDAGSFAEGCAPVSIDSESFYIDGKGERI